jgi:hypothetical protein
MKKFALAACAALGLAILPAKAADTSAPNETGPTTLNVQNMTFDMWCQDTQRYSFERCQARNVKDQQDFELYRNTVENYEVQYLQDKQKDAEFQRQLTHDPSVPSGTHTTGHWPD